jgi:CRP-like cAMP-binding protein
MMPDSATAVRGGKLLEKCPLFATLDDEGRHELIARAWPRHVAAGQPICYVGEPGHNMMAIILADLPAGELFGEIAMLDGKSRSANATALTNCELVVLERQHVLPILEKYPTACLKMMEILCARIRRSDERMADIAFFDLPSRLAKTLLNYPAAGHGVAKLSLSQRELAEMAGGTRENVNRCMRDWHRRGILKLKDRWTIILQPEALRRLVGEA